MYGKRIRLGRSGLRYGEEFVPFDDQARCAHFWAITDRRKYKYTLDVDGFGWTARWRRQLSTGSVVLKASIYVSFGAIWMLMNSPSGGL